MYLLAFETMDTRQAALIYHDKKVVGNIIEEDSHVYVLVLRSQRIKLTRKIYGLLRKFIPYMVFKQIYQVYKI